MPVRLTSCEPHRVAVAAAIASLVGLTLFSATVAQERALPRPVSLNIVWPASGVERVDGNGLSLDDGVASVDGSDQYGLASLSVDEAQSIVRFTYIDAWTLTATRPASCAFTYRRVERTLNQVEANALSDTLATAEFQAIRTAHPDLVRVGQRAREGSAVARQVDRFTYGGTDATTHGLSKSWVFVRLGKAYYVNKVCLAPDDEAGLTVIDQLVGLNYRTGDAPTVATPMSAAVAEPLAVEEPSNPAPQPPTPTPIMPDATVIQPPAATAAVQAEPGPVAEASAPEPPLVEPVAMPQDANSATPPEPEATPAPVNAPPGVQAFRVAPSSIPPADTAASATRSLNQASPRLQDERFQQ